MILIKYWLPVVSCMALIFYASSMSGDSLPLLFSFQSVAFHFFAYSILAYFFIRALKKTYPGITPAAALFLTAAFAALYGLSDELHQLFVACRHTSAFDVFMDSLGGFFGGMVFQLIYGRDKALQGDCLQ